MFFKILFLKSHDLWKSYTMMEADKDTDITGVKRQGRRQPKAVFTSAIHGYGSGYGKNCDEWFSMSRCG